MIVEPWIAVDLDGTLAFYDGWVAPDFIGRPIDPMVARVRGWLASGKKVKIFTARVAFPHDAEEMKIIVPAIQQWCQTHIGCILEITCTKDLGMVELWDDRCYRIVTNRGVTCCVYSENRAMLPLPKKPKPFAPPLKGRSGR